MSKPWEKRLHETIASIQAAPAGGTILADLAAVWINQRGLADRQAISAALSFEGHGLFSRGSAATRATARATVLLRIMAAEDRRAALSAAPVGLGALLGEHPEHLRTAFAKAASAARQKGFPRIDQDVLYMPRGVEFLSELFTRQLLTDKRWNRTVNMYPEAIVGRPMALAGVSPGRQIFLLVHGGIGFSTKGTRWRDIDMADQLERDGLNKLHRQMTLLVCNAGQAAHSKAGAAEMERLRREHAAMKPELLRLELAGDLAGLAAHKAQMEKIGKRYAEIDNTEYARDTPSRGWLEPLGQRLSRILNERGYGALRITAFKGEVRMGLGDSNSQIEVTRYDAENNAYHAKAYDHAVTYQRGVPV